jgi:NitT/TauT family transport system substrate-binding protein
MKKIVLLLSITALILSGCSTAASTPTALTRIQLPMGYTANVQFAPFYVAVDKGYFAQEGLDVQFDYRFETDGMKLVGAGTLPFAVVSGEQVPLARSQGLPVTYVMQWFQSFPIGVVALSDKNIKTPADLIGKSVGLPGFFGASYIGWRGLLYKANIKEADIKTQDIGFTQAAALQQGKVDAIVGYTNNEPLQLIAAGLKIDVIPVSDYVSLVANGIVTNDSTVKNNPKLVTGFLRALVHGLQDVRNNPNEAFTISTKYVDGLGKDPQNDALQMQVLTASIKLWTIDGRSNPTAWDTTQEVLVNMGLINTKLDATQLFTNDFLPKAGK